MADFFTSMTIITQLSVGMYLIVLLIVNLNKIFKPKYPINLAEYIIKIFKKYF